MPHAFERPLRAGVIERTAMNRRHFLAASAALAVTAPRSLHASAIPAAASSSVSTLPAFARYQLTLERVLSGPNPAYTSSFLLEDLRGTPGSRRFTNFSGDLSGRWIGALTSSAAAFGQSFPALQSFVRAALPLQHPEGYFGATFNADQPTDDDLALLWGNGRLLVGLLEYNSHYPDPAVLAAARRLGDFLVSIGSLFNSSAMADAFSAAHFASSYICWTQQTEGLAALYAETHDSRYRDLCAEIASRMERRPGDHVHGYLCSVRGVLDLYNATGDIAHLIRVIAAWNDIEQSGDVLITGGVPEAWSPKRKRTEGCAECDWLRLNLALHRATGEEKYLEVAETAAFNEFAMNQFATGDFGHGTLDAAGIPTTVAVRAWWCCTLHGLRAFSDLHTHVFRIRENEIFYDLPLDGLLRAGTIEADSHSTLAADGKVSIVLRRAAATQSLTVRQPAWATAVRLRHNGLPVTGLRIPVLRSGDTVTAKYEMARRTKTVPAAESLPARTAIFVGPWLLGASSHDQPGYFNELHIDNRLLAGSLHAVSTRNASPFAVPIAASACTFTPAEYPEQPGYVQLRAVAEQTACDPARWMTAFLTRSTS